MPAPMPLEPPVTRATLPLNDFVCICHQNPLSHPLCPFWIILSRMAVQRDRFPGCPTRSFFLSLCFSRRVQRQRKALDEPTSGLSATRNLSLDQGAKFRLVGLPDMCFWDNSTSPICAVDSMW